MVFDKYQFIELYADTNREGPRAYRFLPQQRLVTACRRLPTNSNLSSCMQIRTGKAQGRIDSCRSKGSHCLSTLADKFLFIAENISSHFSAFGV